MESIADQDYSGKMEHIIIGDNCPHININKSDLEMFYRNKGSEVDVIILNRNIDEDLYLWERVAAHKNFAITLSSGTLIANLDDDNTLEPSHFSSLQKLLSKNFDAVHSWRRLFYKDGTPYYSNHYPWIIGDDIFRAELLYKIQKKQGIFSENDNLVKDSLFLKYKDNFYCTVDASEWLLRKDLFTDGIIKYTDNYSYTDILYGHCEDYLFGTNIRNAGLKIGCTESPTLNYYLSGNSQTPTKN